MENSYINLIINVLLKFLQQNLIYYLCLPIVGEPKNGPRKTKRTDEKTDRSASKMASRKSKVAGTKSTEVLLK